MNDSSPWILKYSPKNVDDMIMTKTLKGFFKDIIESKNLNSITIFGKPGIGKSTLSKILVDNLGCEYWFQPCSVDGSIDMVKTTIKDFCDIIPTGKYKIIILDEADQLSQQAQMALRDIIYQSTKNCRFILTANYEDKIIDALKSRCVPVKLDFSTKHILAFCKKILDTEKIEYENKDLLDFYNEVIVKKFPDVRSIIEYLQMMSISGHLKILMTSEKEIHNDVVDFVYDNITKDTVSVIRKWLLQNEDKFSADYVKLSQDLFDKYEENSEIMGIIADYLWRMSFQLDKEIQFIGMLINIKNALKK